MTRWLAGLLLASLVTGCGFLGIGDSGFEVTVTDLDENAPPELAAAEKPAAAYYAESRSIVFVSSPLYSGSCPPDGEAEVEQPESATVTLTITPYGGGDACTSDAGRYTFTIANLEVTPAELVVEEVGADDIRIDVTDRP